MSTSNSSDINNDKWYHFTPIEYLILVVILGIIFGVFGSVASRQKKCNDLLKQAPTFSDSLYIEMNCMRTKR